jgi:3-oxoadipate enol-lactonase/4-carboxymuconolactone decarboxylase
MIPEVVGVHLAGGPGLPLLICGPSLGTSVTALWSGCAARLGDAFHVVGWELPGHGRSARPVEPFDIAELAAGVLALADRALSDRGEAGGAFGYAGVSTGGAVGLQLLLDAPQRVRAAVLLSTGAKIGDSAAWRERAEQVRASGTPAVLEQSARRWFAPGFVDREPSSAATLLHSLQDADRHGYALACEALAAFDVRDRLAAVGASVLAVAGELDVATPPAALRELADGVQRGRCVVLGNAAHLTPAEAPAEVAQLIREHLVGFPSDRHAAGMRVRREVLGDPHVDRASARASELTREFQQLITEYAWGSIWTRPGLDRRSRSLITLTALVAGGHAEELAMHVRAARRMGISVAEIKEVLLQAAIYCGVPAANTAFRIAQQVLEDE